MANIHARFVTPELSWELPVSSFFKSLYLQASTFGIQLKAFSSKNLTKKYNIGNIYRLITLTVYVGKLIERIIDRRLGTELEAKELIDERQEGFKKRRGPGRCIYKHIDNYQNKIW